MSACAADIVDPAQPSADVSEEGLWLGRGADWRDARVRAAFWARWRQWLRDQEERQCGAGESDDDDATPDDDRPGSGSDRPEPDDSDHDQSTPADDETADDETADDEPAGDEPADDEPADDEPADDEPADDEGSAQSGPRDDPATPGDDRVNYVQCGAANSCGPGTGCCETTSQCTGGFRLCLTGPIVRCDGPEDCPMDNQRCWGGPAPQCAGVGARLKCHTDADCDGARSRCNADGDCDF